MKISRRPDALPVSKTELTPAEPSLRPSEPPRSDAFNPSRQPPVELRDGATQFSSRAPVFTGFDAEKLAAPLKLNDKGEIKSAKYTFAKLAQASGVMPQSKAESEAWFNQYIRPGMEEAGFGVDWVKGDKAFIRTRENPDGEVVDFVRGAGSNDPNYIALAWQPETPGGDAGSTIDLNDPLAALKKKTWVKGRRPDEPDEQQEAIARLRAERAKKP